MSLPFPPHVQTEKRAQTTAEHSPVLHCITKRQKYHSPYMCTGNSILTLWLSVTVAISLFSRILH